MTATLAWRVPLIAAVLSLFGSCVAVPSHDGLARVRVSDVVKRIKCDLAIIVFNKAQERTVDGHFPFVFLKDWAAKIHLTIAIDDTFTVNPGASVTTPLDKTVATALLPATTETFTLGIGAGLISEAVRQEDIEFLVSFSDMLKEFDNPSRRGDLYHNCQFEPGLLLESDLGLASLVNSALDPVATGVLYPGNNIGPGITPPPAKPLDDISRTLKQLKTASSGLPPTNPDISISDLANRLRNKSQMEFLIQRYNVPNSLITKSLEEVPSDQKENVSKVKTVLTFQEDATLEETRTQSIVNNIVKPLYTIASASLEPNCLTGITKSQFEAITWAANVSLDVIRVDKATDVTEAQRALEDVKAGKLKVINFADEMVSEIRACGHGPTKKTPPVYDPINVISETVNFFVTTSASVTPSWKLVRITAPIAGTFASGSRKDTNTLILAMGRPQPAANGGITSSAAMDWQILASILSNAVTSRPVLP